MRNPGKGRLLTFEPSSGNWRKNLGTDIRNGSVKKYPIIGIPFGLRPHSIPIMGNDTVNGILPYDNLDKFNSVNFFIEGAKAQISTKHIFSWIIYFYFLEFHLSILYIFPQIIKRSKNPPLFYIDR